MDRKHAAPSPVHTLHIKNMVCDRCIRVVREELARLGHDVRSIVLGEAVIAPPPDAAAMDDIRRVLEENGFELLDKDTIGARLAAIVRQETARGLPRRCAMRWTI